MQQLALFERKKMKSPSIKNYLNQISFKLTTREEFIISPWRGVGFSTSKNKIEYILYRRILQMGHVWYKLTEERASLHLSFSYETTHILFYNLRYTYTTFRNCWCACKMLPSNHRLACMCEACLPDKGIWMLQILESNILTKVIQLAFSYMDTVFASYILI